MFRNVAELVQLAESNQVKIAEIMIRQEIEVSGLSREEVIANG
jgi:L-serine dehydratase